MALKKEEDPNLLIKFEKAIEEKYGEDTIINPKKSWDQEKEKEYLQSLKGFYKDSEEPDNVDVGGVFIPKKLINKESLRTCSLCEEYSVNSKDDVYMTKYSCCYKCYIYNIEGREEKWKKRSV